MANRLFQFAAARERGAHTRCEPELGLDFVPRDQANIFLGRMRLPTGNRMTILRNGGGAPGGISSEIAQQIKKMSPQDEHILAASALILFSVGANLQEVA